MQKTRALRFTPSRWALTLLAAVLLACPLPPPAAAQQRTPEPWPSSPSRPDALPRDKSQEPGTHSEPRAKDEKGRPPQVPGKRADADKAPKPIPKSMRRPGATAVPEGGAERAALLAELYAHLATADGEEVASQTANAIEHVWAAANSDTVNILTERAARAVKEKKLPLAMKLYEQAIALSPDNPEVFSRRALAHYANNDFALAMGDLRRVLALDPNHYKALDGLGQILKELDRKKAALDVYRRLYQVYPHYSGVKSAVEELERDVEGQRS
jgi:tetratricopeptide (TPR) repeat protein